MWNLGHVAFCFVYTVIVAAVPEDVTQLLPGRVNGGFVANDGHTSVVAALEPVAALERRLRGDSPTDFTERSVVLIQMKQGRVQLSSLGREYAGTNSTVFLDDRTLLLTGHRGPVIDGYTSLTLDVVEIRNGEVRRVWGWNSREDAPECRHCPAPIVSRDGRMWGYAYRADDASTRVTFAFGPGRDQRVPERVELVDFPSSDRDKLPMWGYFWFLDGRGPVVLVPWSGGGFIVHFNEGASPHVVSVLQGSTQWAFTWQHEERVLWAEDGGRLRAYNLWDLGLSGFPDAPFWELSAKDGWEPHADRGAVRVAIGRDGYRIEHLWREPWTLLEERHVSAWNPGAPPAGGIGRSVLVSANGRHAAVFEGGRSEEGENVTHYRRLGLELEREGPPIEAAPAGQDQQREPVRRDQ